MDELGSNLRQKYPGNTAKTETPRNSVKPATNVTKGKVTVKKTDIKRRLIESFTGGATTKDIGEYFLFDILVPTIKNAIDDVFGMVLWGDTRGSSRKKSGNRNYVSYNSIYDGAKRREKDNRRSDEIKQLTFSSKGDAEEVLSELVRRVDEYDLATLRDYYELTGQSFTHMDDKYGWTDLSAAYVTRDYDGYTISFPRVKAID